MGRCGPGRRPGGIETGRRDGIRERGSGDERLRAYGEARVCAGIIGHVDLTIGGAAREVLEAHTAAGGGRFRGIRPTARRLERRSRRARDAQP